MKYKVGDKCMVKPECKDKCINCSCLDFDYIEIKELGGYRYIAIKNGESISACSYCYKDEDLLPYKSKKDIADISTYEVGDILIDEDGDSNMVLGIHNKLVFISGTQNYDTANSFHTVFELKKFGYKFKEQEEGIIELTLEDMAKLKGVDVSKIKIKE